MKKNNSSSVKNYQSDFVIKKIYETHFHKNADNLNISILSGGLKNAVYLIDDGIEKVVLKIAPKDETKMISADRNILWWEAKMLKLMNECDIPTPKFIAYDNSGNICQSSYILMSYIKGKNYLEIKETLSAEEVANIEYQLGVISKKICSIKGNAFFLPSQPNKKFNNNFEFVLNLFELLLSDAKSKNMDLGDDSYNIIRNIIYSKKDSLNNISNLCLNHTDIWDGNVIVNNGQVEGIVDFTDLYVCDELMTFYFHTIDGITSENFLRGFDNKVLNTDEKIRIEIYRMYTILKMIVDCELKQYGRFDWMYENLNSKIDVLQRVKK